MFFAHSIAGLSRLAFALGFVLGGADLTRAVQLTAGNTVTLSVTADGTAPFSYQWLKNSVKISGATGSSFAISSAQLADAGDYSAIVSNSAGSITAPAETLTVISPTTVTNPGLTDTTPSTPAVTSTPTVVTSPPLTGTGTTIPSIYAQPLRETATIGHDAAFTAMVVGGSGQWQVSSDGSSWNNLIDGGQYSGVTTGTLLVNGVTPALNGFKFRFVSGGGTSNMVSLGVIEAFFPFPMSIAADGSGNLYVGDTSTDTIQKISATGAVTLLAGSPGQTGTADGSGANARFNDPSGVCAASDGSLGVCDNANGTLRLVTVNGTVTTLAGSTGLRGNTDGVGSAATFSSPTSVCRDAAGNFYLSDAVNNTIRKITAGGAVSTLAGSAGIAGTADGVGAGARFNHPTGMAVDGAGNIYVADTTNNTVREITSTGEVSTIAGLPGVSGSQDGAGSGAFFNNPSGVAADGDGNVYVADTGNSVIRKIAANGVVTTIAGLSGIAGLMDGVGNNAWFNQPKGIVLDSSGVLYVADTGNAAIRLVTLGGSVTTLDLSSGVSQVNNSDNVPAITQTVATSNTSAPGVAISGASSSGGGTMNSGIVIALLLACSLRAALLTRRRAGAERAKSASVLVKWNGWAPPLN
ncbi:MAG TPA: hypothetical protein VGM64_14665 [Lacunisphaera sp.]|jgi:hypothetical protein